MGTGRSNRDSVGARATATIAGRRLTQEVSGGQSYLSAPEKTLTFGLGDAARIDALEIRWPDGSHERLEGLSGGTSKTIERGGSRRP